MKKKFILNLKEPQLEVINYLKKKFSISSNKEMVNKCIKSALNLNKNDLIFNPVIKNSEKVVLHQNLNFRLM